MMNVIDYWYFEEEIDFDLALALTDTVDWMLMKGVK